MGLVFINIMNIDQDGLPQQDTGGNLVRNLVRKIVDDEMLPQTDTRNLYYLLATLHECLKLGQVTSDRVTR